MSSGWRCQLRFVSFGQAVIGCRVRQDIVFVGQKPAVAGASAIDVVGYLTREEVETVGRLRK